MTEEQAYKWRIYCMISVRIMADIGCFIMQVIYRRHSFCR